jgi:hypothetical protein
MRLIDGHGQLHSQGSVMEAIDTQDLFLIL